MINRFLSKVEPLRCDSSSIASDHGIQIVVSRGTSTTADDTPDDDYDSRELNQSLDITDESLIVDFPEIPRRRFLSVECGVDFNANEEPKCLMEIVQVRQCEAPSKMGQLQSKQLYPKEQRMKSAYNLSPKNPKRVSFSPHSTLHRWEISYNNDYSRYCSTWYNKSDYRKFHRTTKFEASLERQRAAIIAEDDVHCCDSEILHKIGRKNGCCPHSETDDETAVSLRRGIEHLLCPKTLRQIMKCRELHKNTVLQQQLIVNSEQKLRSASKRVSKWGKARAWTYANVEGLGDSKPSKGSAV